MKIEVWSDMVCPFCYIGKRRLEAALASFVHRNEVEVEFKSFELDPNAAVASGKSIHEILAEKYGMSVEQAKAANARMVEQAATVGLTYHFDTMIPTNTFAAHRLTQWAKTQGKMAEVTEAIFYAYFTDSKNISDYATLADLASSVGLNREEAETVLANGSFADEVRHDEQEAMQLGVNGVPFFVLNRRYAVSGAQPMDVFVQALDKAWGEENPITVLSDANDGNACTTDNCAIPTPKND